MEMKELKDGVQTIRYQLSTLQTTNGQIGLIYQKQYTKLKGGELVIARCDIINNIAIGED